MQHLIDLGLKLFPINRSITGKGTLKTLEILKKKINLIKIKSFPSRKKVFDWKIPDEWNVNDAYIKDKFGKKIVNLANNNLHLISYSKPFKGFLKKKKLLNKLYSLKSLPNAIPYKTSYYKKDWGFCVSNIQKTYIKKKYNLNDKFKVYIDSSFKKKGKLHYGEVYLPGVSKKEVLISTYICHPSMANNELSGPLLTTEIIKYFKKKKNKLSLRFLFIPETIGSIAYINKNLKRLKKKIIGGLVLTCIGDENKFSYLSTKYQNTISDQAILETFKALKIKFKKFSFLERGSDERQYNSPGVDLNIASVMRSKYGTYKEYHTSLDNFNLVTKKGLRKSFIVVKKILINLMKKKFKRKGRLQNKFNPIVTKICEPNLGKRNMYPLLGSRGASGSVRNILNFLQYSDGTNNIKEISKFIKCNLSQTNKIKKTLLKEKLIKLVNEKANS